MEASEQIRTMSSSRSWRKKSIGREEEEEERASSISHHLMGRDSAAAVATPEGGKKRMDERHRPARAHQERESNTLRFYKGYSEIL